MSCAGNPALKAIAKPSPVLIKALVVDAYILPAPPVARTVACAFKYATSPFSIEKAITPVTSSFEFFTKSTANHSLRKLAPSLTLF